ncbi:MAG: hypothetical protein DYH13_02725 [Alphaproteobacteria bacterium PRO2]|nr:hypothetical protein [Alphaproteobacteria bacterium PRO2]
MRILPFLLLFALLPAPLFAADEKPAAAAEAPKQDPADLDKRIALSKKWHGLMPVSVRDQVNIAIDEAAAMQPENQKEIFRANMRNILNYQAIEKISIDAMAEIYTVAELQALVDYYSKPEAKSATAKHQLYAGKVYPEITRMLDQAMMKARTGGVGTGGPSTPVPPASGQ